MKNNQNNQSFFAPLRLCAKLLLFISAIFTLNAQDPASNIRVQAMSNIFIVFYDLSETSDVEAFVSFDNGATWQGPLQNVSGSVGKEVAEGKEKIILWHAVEEIGYVEKDVTVKVIATKITMAQKPPDVAVFLETVNPVITPPTQPPASEESQASEEIAIEAPPVETTAPTPQPVAVQTQPPPQTVYQPQANAGRGTWTVIIGSFSTHQMAEIFARTVLAEDGINCEIIDAGNRRYRVSAGRFETAAEAIRLANQIRPKRQVWVAGIDN